MTNEEAIRILKTIRGRAVHGYTYADALTYAIEVLEQQKVGYWKRSINDNICSVCGEHSNTLWRSKYCPNCGARTEENE